MLVTTATVGESFRNEPSLSSASATRNSLAPASRWIRDCSAFHPRPPSGPSRQSRAPWRPSRLSWSSRAFLRSRSRTSSASTPPASRRAGSRGSSGGAPRGPRVVGPDRRGDDHDVTVGRDIRGGVPRPHLRPEQLERSVVSGAAQVGPRHPVSEVQEQFPRSRSFRCRRSRRSGWGVPSILRRDPLPRNVPDSRSAVRTASAAASGREKETAAVPARSLASDPPPRRHSVDQSASSVASPSGSHAPAPGSAELPRVPRLVLVRRERVRNEHARASEEAPLRRWRGLRRASARRGSAGTSPRSGR